MVKENVMIISVLDFFLIKKSMNFSNFQLVKPNVEEALKEKEKKKNFLDMYADFHFGC